MSTPTKPGDESLAYFWTDFWQEAEHEADRDLKEGNVEAYESVEDLIKALEHPAEQSA